MELTVEGLDDKILDAGLYRLDYHGLLAHGGAHHHIGLVVLGADRLQRLQSVHVRHGDVHQDQIRLEFKILFHSILAVHRLVQVGKAILGQRVPDHLPHEGCVVNNQNLSHVLNPLFYFSLT